MVPSVGNFKRLSKQLIPLITHLVNFCFPFIGISVNIAALFDFLFYRVKSKSETLFCIVTLNSINMSEIGKK